jgi:type II secretion system protein D
MHASPSSVWKATSLVTLLGLLGVWAVWARAADDEKPVKPSLPVNAPKTANTKPGDKQDAARFGVNFSGTSWQSVLEWFSKASGQAMIGGEVPPGSFTYISPDPSRKYTIPEIVDILNDALQAQNYTLIRHARSFSIMPADKPIDPGQLPRVSVENLDQYGDSELLSVSIPLTSLSAEDLAPQVEKLVGPFGKVAGISQPNQLVIQDTGRNLRRIRDMIEGYERGERGGSLTYVCNYIKAREAARMLKDMLGVKDPTPTPAPMPGGFDRERGRFSGGFQGRDFNPAMAAAMAAQQSATKTKPTHVYADERLNKVYVSGSPDAIAQARQFLEAADKPQTVDQKRVIPGQLESKIYTVPSGSADAISKMLKEFYKDSSVIKIDTGGTNSVIVFAPADDQVEIAKRIYDTNDAATKTERIPLNLLDAGQAAERLKEILGIDAAKTGSLYIGADPDGNALIVRGTQSQVDEIKTVVKILGETTGQSGPLRIISVGRKDPADIAKQVERAIKETRDIPVKIIAPEQPKPAPPKDNGGIRKGGPRADAEAQEEPAVRFTDARPLQNQEKKEAPKPQSPEQKPNEQKPVTISVVGDRLIITCEDPETLNMVHQVARTIIGPGGGTGDFEIIKLKRVSAVDAAKVLDEFFNGPRQPTQNPLAALFGGRNMPANIPQVAPATNKVRVVADPATNSLLVRASPTDRRIIHDILSQSEGGADDTDALIKPYIIGPLKNTSANDVANVIRDVYREYMSTAPSATIVSGASGFGGQFRRPGRFDPTQQQAVTLSVAVDDRSNSLIVNCNRSMYEDILALADRLDYAASSASKTIRVVSSKDIDPYVVQQAVAAMQGQPTMTAMGRPGSQGPGGFNPFQGGNQFGNNPFMNRGATFGPFGGNNPAMMGGRGNMMQPGTFPNQGGFNRGNFGPGGNFPGGGMRPGGGFQPGGRTSAVPAGGGGRNFFVERVKDDPEQLVLYDPQLERERERTARVSETASAIQPVSFSVQQPATPPAPSASDNIQAPRSGVTVEPLPDLGVFIVTGNNQADVEAVLRVIDLLRQYGATAQIKFELVPLQQGDPTVVANFLNQVFQGVAFSPGSTSVSRQQQQRPQQPFSPFFAGAAQQAVPQGSVALFPVPRQNAIFVVAPEARLNDVKEEIRKLDRPITKNAEAETIYLKKASATQVATLLTNFYATQPYGPESNQIRINPDVSSNSILVQAAPADMAQIRKIIQRLDTKESGAINDLRVVPLRNQLSDDLAILLQQAINQAVGATATTQPGVAAIPGLAQAGATGTGTTTKNVTIRFTLPNGQAVQSGLLEDVYVLSSPRINSLIVMAPEKTMELIVSLIKELDTVPKLKADIKVFPLQKSNAPAMATLLQQLFLGSTTAAPTTPSPTLPGIPGAPAVPRPPTPTTGAPGASTVSGGESAPILPPQVTVDERTNSVIVAGSPGDIELITDLIRYLEDTQVQARHNEVYHLRNASAADVAQALTNFYANALAVIQRGGQLPPFQSFEREVVIIAEPVTNKLLISATPKYFGEVMRLIQQLDMAPPQVMVYALIAQVDLTGNEEFGVEIGLQSPVLFERSIFPQTAFIAGSDVNITGPTSGEPLPTLVPAGVVVNSTNPVAQPGFNFNTTAPLGNNPFAPGRSIVGFQGLGSFGTGRNSPNQNFGGFVFSAASDSFNLLVRALKQQGRLQVLSRPQLMTLDNQSAFVLVGQDFPYVTNTNVTNVAVTNSVEYRPVGVQLTVTPRISPDGTVIMRVRPEISSVGTGSIAIGGGAVAVPFNVQTVETTVLAQDGETVVIGGLITHRDFKNENKIPWFGDLPVAGALFRYRTQAKSKTELIVILTPRIIYNKMDTSAILAEETQKMDWLWGDVLRLYDTPGMKEVAPPPDRAKMRPYPGTDHETLLGDPPPVFSMDGPPLGEPPPVFSPDGPPLGESPPVYMPNGQPTLGDPVIAEPIPAPPHPAPPVPRPMPPSTDPAKPVPMPDSSTRNTSANTEFGRGPAGPPVSRTMPPLPSGIVPRAPQPMPNRQ